MISKSDSELTFKKSMNLQVRTREIDIFKLQSPIAEVVKRAIKVMEKLKKYSYLAN